MVRPIFGSILAKRATYTVYGMAESFSIFPKMLNDSAIARLLLPLPPLPEIFEGE